MDDLVIGERLTIPAVELRESFVRSSGPGGQNVNKVATKVELRWAPGESSLLACVDGDWLLSRLAGKLTAGGDLVVTSSRTRDQAKNRHDVRAKLAALVRGALERPKRRRRTAPTRHAIERRISEKMQKGLIKRDRRTTDGDSL